MQLNQIGQIARAVSDVDAAEKFYGEVLGLRKLYRYGDLLFYDCAGVRLLIEKPENGAAVQPGGAIYFRMPDLFLHVGGTHVHHLNYGIFLLSAVGAWLLFARPSGRLLEVAAAVYALGMGLTFDEFGMWLHLGGGYWQRASYDAVVVIATLIALIAFAPSLRDWHQRHSLAAVVAGAASILFFALLVDSLSHIERRVEPRLERLEGEGPV